MMESLNNPAFFQTVALKSVGIGLCPKSSQKFTNISEDAAVSHFVKKVETDFKMSVWELKV